MTQPPSAPTSSLLANFQHTVKNGFVSAFHPFESLFDLTLQNFPEQYKECFHGEFLDFMISLLYDLFEDIDWGVVELANGSKILPLLVKADLYQSKIPGFEKKDECIVQFKRFLLKKLSEMINDLKRGNLELTTKIAQLS
ncbi:hypothetical protein RCL1_007040 [Eukaryota sp. TZLM3-RCL]